MKQTHVEAGDRVEFLGWGKHDPYSKLREGTQGTVTFVDDFGTLHVSWDDGSRLGLVTRPMRPDEPGFRADRYRVVS